MSLFKIGGRLPKLTQAEQNRTLVVVETRSLTWVLFQPLKRRFELARGVQILKLVPVANVCHSFEVTGWSRVLATKISW